jgi:hypothetical protein
MNGKYIYHTIYSAGFVKFSIFNAKIGVKEILWCNYFRINWAACFDATVCSKIRID